MGSKGSTGVAGPVDPPLAAVRETVSRALAEDLLPLGDLTGALVPEDATARGVFASRGRGVVAGRLCVLEAFAQVDARVRIEWHLRDGREVAPGAVVAEVQGPLRSLLAAERTALNFLCHLSGVATLTRRFVDAVGEVNGATRVLDTRKTTPGLRALEKAAVRAGGGWNHRGSLSEAVLVKDNHLAHLTIADAVGRARRLWPGREVEVECDRIGQVAEAVEAGASAVLLDNMTPEEVARCADLVHERTSGAAHERASGATLERASGAAHERASGATLERASGATLERASGATLVEVSGRVGLEAAADYAHAGADLISVGALTHSAPVLDIGFDLAAPTAEGAPGERDGA